MSNRIASTALVTGANRGLGFEWVRQLVEDVDHLFAACRQPEEAQMLTDLADVHSETIDVIALDVTDASAISRVADRVERVVGTLDLLINNAGTNGGGSGDRFGTVDADTMMNVLRVNTVAPHLMTQAFAELIRTDENEAIVVNVTSQLGSISRTSGGGWHSYKASKAALNMCTRLQAGAFEQDSVTVVAMHPGWVRTDMGGSNARLAPEESVNGMIDVISNLTPDDAGRFLTYEGQELPW